MGLVGMLVTMGIIVNLCAMYLRGSQEACLLFTAISWCGVWGLVFEVRAWSSQSTRRCWIYLQWTSSVMAGTLMYFWVWAPLEISDSFEISDCPWLWAVMVMLAELVRPIVCSLFAELDALLALVGLFAMALITSAILAWFSTMLNPSAIAFSFMCAISWWLVWYYFLYEVRQWLGQPAPAPTSSAPASPATIEVCSICLESKDISGPPLSVCGKCGQTFHTRCIDKMKQHGSSKCPLCRWEHGVVPMSQVDIVLGTLTRVKSRL